MMHLLAVQRNSQVHRRSWIALFVTVIASGSVPANGATQSAFSSVHARRAQAGQGDVD